MLSVVVSTRGAGGRKLARLLPTLRSAGNGDWEVVIIDQNDDDSIYRSNARLLEANSRIRWERSSTRGLSAGRNYGMSIARGDWYWFLDDDAWLPEGALDTVISRTNVVSMRRTVYFCEVYDPIKEEPFLARPPHSQTLRLWHFDKVCSVGLLIPAALIQDVGGFDEEFGVGANFGAGEESDLLLRAMRRDWTLVALPELRVYHEIERPVYEKRYSYGRGIGALYAKHLKLGGVGRWVLATKLGIQICARLTVAVLSFIVERPRWRGQRPYLRGLRTGWSEMRSR